MTLEQVEDSLPDGFHDALLFGLSVDYEKRICTLRIEVDVGQTERRVDVILSGLFYCLVEAPDASYPFSSSDSVCVSGGETTERLLPTIGALRSKAPQGTFFYSFFVNQWNSFIHVAATGAELVWSDRTEAPAPPMPTSGEHAQ